ncbi:hypothetical protein BASA60_000630 [Batrachochytrium salamandrivorans]|nr:hypothetical protein BASA60_000630 [Batrachochytrium salamandrivorans]
MQALQQQQISPAATSYNSCNRFQQQQPYLVVVSIKASSAPLLPLRGSRNNSNESEMRLGVASPSMMLYRLPLRLILV